MKILAIETATPMLGLALLENDAPLAAYHHNTNLSHLSEINAHIQWMLDEKKIAFKDIGAVAISAGPGSFTGLRIGFAVAKTIAAECNVPLIPVTTHEAHALQYRDFNRTTIILHDARKNRMFTGAYAWDSAGMPQLIGDVMDITIDDLTAFINLKIAHDEPLLFSGTGLDRHYEDIELLFGKRAVLMPEKYRYPDAGDVGRIAWKCYSEAVAASETFPSPFEINPAYLRKSDAELLYRA